MSGTTEPPANRRFDWGPTSDQSLDGVKEWAVYAILVVLMGVCGWCLIDFDKAPLAVRPTEAPLPDAPTPTVVAGAGAGPVRPAGPGSSGRAAGTGAGTEMKTGAGRGTAPGEGSPAGAAVPDAPLAFHVQLGAFGDEDSARLAQERARKKGFEAVLTKPNDQYEMYRLTIGPFADEAAAEKVARQLNELDFPCFVIESP